MQNFARGACLQLPPPSRKKKKKKRVQCPGVIFDLATPLRYGTAVLSSPRYGAAVLSSPRYGAAVLYSPRYGAAVLSSDSPFILGLASVFTVINSLVFTTLWRGCSVFRLIFHPRVGFCFHCDQLVFTTPWRGCSVFTTPWRGCSVFTTPWCGCSVFTTLWSGCSVFKLSSSQTEMRVDN